MTGAGGLNWRVTTLLKAFTTPAKSLGVLDPEVAAALIAAASDLALIIDEHGTVEDVSFNGDELSRDLDIHSSWVGQRWLDIVTVESRPKVDALLRDAVTTTQPRWRHLNHPTGRGSDVPILYSAVRLGQAGRVVAFGRDLRAISELQQRLVNAQQSLEQDYSRLRHTEMRYRLLFQMSSEAVLILDAGSLKVTEANPAAHRLFGDAIKQVLARGLSQVFDPPGAEAIHALLNTVRVAGRAEGARARLLHDKRDVIVSASLFREDSASLFLVRVASGEANDNTVAVSPVKSTLLQLVESAPDGFVVVGMDGRIVTANAAFVELAQLASEEAARGENLDRWLGREGVDIDVLLANLRQRGSVRLFATILRGEYGATVDVEVSAVAVTNAGQNCCGLAIRNVSRRMAVAEQVGDWPRPVEHLAELIGRVSLKELVRQSTDVIERLCIEAALKMTGDNRASAAEMLGLSRQSFYVKLRRYGLGDLASDSSDLV
jgi:transcriptional regulator PpsR